MSNRIYKYPLPRAGGGFVETPAGATLLAAVHVQGNKPMLWFLVDPDEPRKVCWEVYVAVTGEPLEDSNAMPDLSKARYLGTFQIAGAIVHPVGLQHFVGHVFVFVPDGHEILAAGQAAGKG